MLCIQDKSWRPPESRVSSQWEQQPVTGMLKYFTWMLVETNQIARTINCLFCIFTSKTSLSTSSWSTCKIIFRFSSWNRKSEYLTEFLQVLSSPWFLEFPGSESEGKVDQEINGKQNTNCEVCCQQLFQNNCLECFGVFCVLVITSINPFRWLKS